jgi:hypothetical protein
MDAVLALLASTLNWSCRSRPFPFREIDRFYPNCVIEDHSSDRRVGWFSHCRSARLAMPKIYNYSLAIYSADSRAVAI